MYAALQDMLEGIDQAHIKARAIIATIATVGANSVSLNSNA
jgi:hypothetical protein